MGIYSVIRSVYGSGRVGFVPDPDPTRNFRVGENRTRNFRVGENRTRNRPGMLVGSAGLGRVGFSSSPVSFGFYRRYRYFGQIREIWPDHDKISLNLVESGLDLAGSRPI